LALSSKLEALTLVPVENLTETQQFELLAIRNQPIIRESSYTQHIIAEDEHRDWLKKIGTDDRFDFFGVIFDQKIVGGAGIQREYTEAREAEWSFYLSEHAHGQGIGLALGVAAMNLFFSQFELERLLGEALSNNVSSLSFHEKLGFIVVGEKKRQLSEGGHEELVQIFAVTADQWINRRRELMSER
jgi:UDP-4-amino-4,6-dideoxy-N-acetyl-beta-L-altrosamine N-acetyltransferase